MNLNSERNRSTYSIDVTIHGGPNGDVVVPVNLNYLSDYEVSELIPKFLSISRSEDNPMLRFTKMYQNHEFDNYSEEELASYIKWVEKLSVYWMAQQSTSVFDVAVAVAIDIKINGVKAIAHALGDDMPDHLYEHYADQPLKDRIDKYLSDMNIDEHESESDRANGIRALQTIDPVTGTTETMSVNIYGSDAVEDFISEEIDKHLITETRDKFNDILAMDVPPDAFEQYRDEARREALREKEAAAPVDMPSKPDTYYDGPDDEPDDDFDNEDQADDDDFDSGLGWNAFSQTDGNDTPF